MRATMSPAKLRGGWVRGGRVRTVRQRSAPGARVVFIATLIALLAACVSTATIQQFALYQGAFDKANATANAILDQLAIRERELFLRKHRVGVDVAALDFDPAHASYYVNSVDPPDTAAFRRALATVKTYNDLLYALASGQTAAAITAKLGELQANLSQAAIAGGSLADSVRKRPLLAQR